MIYISITSPFINKDESSRNKNLIVTGDPGDMIFGTYLMGLCLLDGKLVSKKDPNPNPLFTKLESDWRVFADYMVHKVTHVFFFLKQNLNSDISNNIFQVILYP